jgi:hypothetical protein
MRVMTLSTYAGGMSGFLGTNMLVVWNIKLGMRYEVRFTIKPLKIAKEFLVQQTCGLLPLSPNISRYLVQFYTKESQIFEDRGSTFVYIPERKRKQITYVRITTVVRVNAT